MKIVNSPRILSLKRLYDKYPNKTMHAMKRLIYYIIFFHFLVPAKPGAVRKKRVTGKPTPPELERGQGRDRGRKDTWNLKSKIEKLRQIVTIHSHGDPTIRQNLAKCLNKRLASTTTPNMASFQGVSTSSSTCWTSGLDLLENLDLSLFSDSFQMAPSPNSNNSLQSVQNPSGLFDNELAGIKPDPATTAFDPKTDFTDEGGEPSLDKMGGDVLDMLTSFSDDVNDEYLNSFMDLTGFLQLEDSNFGKTEEECSAPEPEVVEEPVVTKKSKKRKLDEVGEESESFSASVDHDYVSKKPCASSSSTDAEVFVFEEPKTKVAPVEKYRERRVKNNIASRRSREIRKQKFANMEEEAERLVVENAKLHERIAEMEQMAKEMKATLISKLAGK